MSSSARSYRIIVRKPVQCDSAAREELWDYPEGWERSKVVVPLKCPLEFLFCRTNAKVVEDYIAFGESVVDRLLYSLLCVGDEF